MTTEQEVYKQTDIGDSLEDATGKRSVEYKRHTQQFDRNRPSTHDLVRRKSLHF